MYKGSDFIEFTELKQWKNKTPLWALAEVVKNLYMFIHFYINLKANPEYFKNKMDNYDVNSKKYDISNIGTFNLTILAPKEYYDIFKPDGKKFDKEIFEAYNGFCLEFKKYVENDLKAKLNRDIKINFSTKYFNFTRYEYNKLIGRNDEDKYKNSIISLHLKSKNLHLRPKRTEERKSIASEINTGDINLEDYKNLFLCYKNNFKNWLDLTVL